MAYIYDLTDTWNAGGTTFNGIKLNVTDSASAVTSKLVSLQTNGTEHFSVTKAGVGYVSGNLGVGTASPAYKLDVSGQARSFGTPSSFSQLQSLVQYTGSAGPVALGQGSDATGYLINIANASLAFGTNNTERMRIDSSGNVGIGTSSPSYKLDIGGFAAATQTERIAAAAGYDSQLKLMEAADTYGFTIRNANGSGLNILRHSADATGATAMFIGRDTGNVGIGTSVSYGSRLAVVPASTPTTVAGANQIQIGEASANTGYRMQLGYLNNGANGYNGSIQVYDNGNPEDLILNGAGGNVGIGTSNTAPANGTGLVVAAASTIARIDMRNSTTGTASGDGTSLYLSGNDFTIENRENGYIAFATNLTERARIDSSGNLLVGNTTATSTPNAGHCLNYSSGNSYIAIGHISGTADAFPYLTFNYAGGGSYIGSVTQSGTTGVLYNTSSDARLKDNITDADDAASLIDAIQVRKFDWKADGSHQRYGFVAQELVAVAPEAVSQPADPDDMMGVDYSKLVPMLVKEIQSLRARVAQLEGN